jgi:hypothetical protein
MSSHPIATAEQHEHELQAMDLAEHPVVKEAYGKVREHLLKEMDPTPEMRACFPWAFDEVMFSAAIWSANQDPLRPKVICITRLAHDVQGRTVRGSRCG